jgi:hypothetical protein
MSKRNALLWTEALWGLWLKTKDDDEKRFYSRMVKGPAAVLGVTVFESFCNHSS